MHHDLAWRSIRFPVPKIDSARARAKLEGMEDPVPRGPLRSVADLVKTHAAAWGPRAAFHDRQRAVTYRELLDRTGRLAGHLAEIGVARGDRVALVMSNRVEMMESYVAVAR